MEFGSEEALWALLNTQQIESLSCVRVLQEQSSVKYLMGKKTDVVKVFDNQKLPVTWTAWFCFQKWYAFR